MASCSLYTGRQCTLRFKPNTFGPGDKPKHYNIDILAPITYNIFYTLQKHPIAMSYILHIQSHTYTQFL